MIAGPGDGVWKREIEVERRKDEEKGENTIGTGQVVVGGDLWEEKVKERE